MPRGVGPFAFQPGQSGNPAGRPPGSVGFRGAIQRFIRENPERVQAIIMAIAAEAEKGSVAHFKALSEWVELSLPKSVSVSELTAEQAIEILALVENN